jgi:hypothetical protein
MTPKVFASCAVVLIVLATRAASAQPQYTGQSDSPQWLKDRKYNEGIGIRAGDLELHPGVAGEVGYDSNWFLRTDRAQCSGGLTPFCDNGPPKATIIPALEFRVTPSLYLSTLGPERREGDVGPSQRNIAFRAGAHLTYREFIGLKSDPNTDISQQRNVSGAADARLDIQPEHPVGGALFASYARLIQPNSTTSDPNLSFNRDNVGLGGELALQPGSGTLDWRFGYQFSAVLFEENLGAGFNDVTHEAFTRGRWKFRPRTALLYDATLRFISYSNPDQAALQGLVGSTPVRARIGMNGLITDRFTALAMVGWGASFYDNTSPLQPNNCRDAPPPGPPAASFRCSQPQYDSVIGQAELKWFLAASPGIASLPEVGLSLSSIAIGYNRDFQNSFLGNFYGTDRGYLRFAYFFAGRALVSLEGGAGAVEYPDMYFLPTAGLANPVPRHKAFTDIRADATLFGEYRFTDTFGINATLRYTANFSSTHDLPDQPFAPVGASGVFDMSWSKYEAFLGVRWFM